MRASIPRFAFLAVALSSAQLFAATATTVLNKDVMAKEKFPTQNFGTDVNLQVSAQATFQKISYVQFTVSGIPAGSTAITAELRLRSLTTGSSRPVAAHGVTDTSWTEAGLIWNNKPVLGGTLATVSSHTSGSDSVWNVSTHVNGNGTFALGVDTTISGDTTFSSKEGTDAPQLIVNYTPPGATTVSFNATDFNASEASLDPATIQVVSTTAAPAGGLVVNYTVSGIAQKNDNANGAPDYILAPANGTATTGSVTIAAGATTATITLTPIQDTLFEGKEAAIFTLAASGGYTVGTPRVAQVVIADNETVPSVNPDHSLNGSGTADDDEGGWRVPITGTLPNGECSGMVASRVYPGVHWYHRDGTQNPDPREKIYAIEVSHGTNNGTVIKTIDVQAPAGWSGTWVNQQWEDIAEDPDVPGVLWIADIGNNANPPTRTDIKLFKLNEPNPYGAATSVQVSTAYYLRYPSGLAFNAEVLFIFEGIPHIIVKESGNPRIYRAPTTTLSTNAGSPTIMELVGQALGGPSNQSVGAFSADRRRMVLADHARMFVYASQSALNPVGTTLTPAQALSYIQDLLCTRQPAWALKHNGGQQDPEATKGSVEGGSFVGDSYDILFGAEGRQVVFLPAWWYETQIPPIIVPPSAPVPGNAAPSTLLFKPSDGATFSKATSSSVTLQAAGSDYDGTIANVKFYQKHSSAGSRTLIGTGTATGGYHQLSWNISAATTGSYTVSADSTDNSGAVTTDSVTITINP
ncbi:MAG: DNRLRE domain-containing protein [Verrucomicrobiota bacterium]